MLLLLLLLLLPLNTCHVRTIKRVAEGCSGAGGSARCTQTEAAHAEVQQPSQRFTMAQAVSKHHKIVNAALT